MVKKYLILCALICGCTTTSSYNTPFIKPNNNKTINIQIIDNSFEGFKISGYANTINNHLIAAAEEHYKYVNSEPDYQISVETKEWPIRYDHHDMCTMITAMTLFILPCFNKTDLIFYTQVENTKTGKTQAFTFETTIKMYMGLIFLPALPLNLGPVVANNRIVKQLFNEIDLRIASDESN